MSMWPMVHTRISWHSEQPKTNMNFSQRVTSLTILITLYSLLSVNTVNGIVVKLHLYQKHLGLSMYTSQCLSKDMLFSLLILSETGLPACDSYKN